MNDNQSDHLSMYLTVNQFLLDHAPDLAGVTQITGLQALLANRIENITDYAAIAGSDTTGFTIQKSNERLELEAITLKVSRACGAYFLSIDNPGGFKLADYTASEIANKRDNDLYADSKWLYKIADPIKANLSSFNSGPADVLELKNLYDAFFDIIRLPKIKRDEKASGTKMLDKEFEKAQELVEHLDVYMLTFQTIDALLYLEYEKARAIDSTGGGSQNTKSGTLQGNGVANAAFADDKLNASTGLLLYNNSTGPNAGDLVFYFCATPTGAIPDPDKAITLAPGNDLTTTALSIDYSEAQPFLNIFNPTAAVGKWKVVIAE